MTNTYDAIGRITQRRLGLNSNYDTTLTYKPGADGSQTALLATYQNGGDTPYSYEYDANGNITEITQGNVSVTYSYNAANELIRENNGFTNQTVTYTYDSWGNLTEKNVYAYTTAADPGTPTQTIPYAYTNSSWGDQLTSYNNQSILYDAMGNPTSYLGQTLTWRGKQLTAVGTTTYEYDENGLRLNKTVNNVSTDYYYNGSALMSLVTGNDTLLFSYDATGHVAAVNHNGTYYYYLRNGQGDIVKLIDNSGATVVEYSYDTWGKQLSCTGTLASTLGTLNPFRYRGYVYDEETQWYYLQSRYYNPTVGRFISADVLLSTGQGVLGNNCYAYCLGNPVALSDTAGFVSHSIRRIRILTPPVTDERLLHTLAQKIALESFILYLYGQEKNGSIYVRGGNGESSSEIDLAIIRQLETSSIYGNFSKAKEDYENRIKEGGFFRIFDCSGLATYWLLNKKLIPGDLSADGLYDLTNKHNQLNNVKRGDWVFNGTDAKKTHIGYVVDDGYVIHMQRGTGATLEPYNPNKWQYAGRPVKVFGN